MDKEGDVLILDPEKLGKRLPDINFDKMLGRPEPYPIRDENDIGEELILEVNLDAVRKKVPNAPDFSKYTGREEAKRLDDDEVYVVNLDDDPIPNDPGQPRVKAYDFGMAKDRFKDPHED